MPPIEVVFFRDEKGRCQVLEWLSQLPPKSKVKATTRIEELGVLGHELRRPKADCLRDGIYELRWRYRSVNCRILYFYYGQKAVVLSHGLTKEDVVPPSAIDSAIKNKQMFETHPLRHGFMGG